MGTTLLVAIAGTAGVGKTALALHFAHLAADRYPDGQLYVNLRGFGPLGEPLRVTAAMRALLDALQVPPGQIPTGLEAQAGLYRSVLAGRRMLVMLDNAASAAQVRPLLPGGGDCLAVVTSRRQLTALAAAQGAHTVVLDALTDADARELLASRLGAARLAAEPGAARELTAACARLPLALSIAAARAAARPGFPLAMLAAELRDPGRRLDALDAGEAAANVRDVFSWSYQQLSPAAARMSACSRCIRPGYHLLAASVWPESAPTRPGGHSASSWPPACSPSALRAATPSTTFCVPMPPSRPGSPAPAGNRRR